MMTPAGWARRTRGAAPSAGAGASAPAARRPLGEALPRSARFGATRDVLDRDHAPGARTPDAGLHRTLDVAGMARVLGVAADTLPAECVRRITTRDFAYDVLAGAERDAVIQQVTAALLGDLSVSGPARLDAWERGWGDILERFEAADGDPDALVPHYFRPVPMRLDGNWVRPRDPRFELQFVEVLHAWLAGDVLADVPAVWEFGCGPGHNLVGLARLLPGRRFVGLDWAAPSQRILERVRATLGLDVRGVRVDMFAPDSALAIEPGAAVVTIGAMEQLGDRFGAFLAYLLAQRPAVVVHLEPIHELYDRAALFDDLAARYAERRGYLRGYLPALRALAADGTVELLRVQRHLGSLMHDGWGSMVWRPRDAGRGRT